MEARRSPKCCRAQGRILRSSYASSECEFSVQMRSAEARPLTGKSTEWSIAIRRQYGGDLEV